MFAIFFFARKDAVAEQQRRHSALEETFLSADRLLLTARAGCAKRDEQLGQCAVQLGETHVLLMCC